MKPHLSDRLRYFDARIGSPIAVEAADRLEALERENERLTIQAAVTETARRAAERRNAELEAVLQFYAAKESYRNRTVEEQRQLNGGLDPVVARSDVGRAPAGMALSDIQLDNHGDRARAALAGSGGGWPVPEGYALVPVSALKWLNGEGPDANGHWFGDAPDDCKRGAFWWRTKFTAMCSLAPEAIRSLLKEPEGDA